MTIRDKEVKEWLNELMCSDIAESIEDTPAREREGRSDIQVFADEVSDWKSEFEEGGEWHEELEDSKAFIEKTDNGRVSPEEYSKKDVVTNGYSDWYYAKVQACQEVIEEYAQLCRQMDMLHKRGIVGAWE